MDYPKSKRNKSESQIRKKLQLTKNDRLILFSAVDKIGKDEVWNWIESITKVN